MVNIFWFRRDLRLEDNMALDKALSSGIPVLPIFIFDNNITEELSGDDARVSFLCKHLLIDWRWGEAYFAEKLLDYELSSNNGNWQWASGTGCDAAPYFRIFNPSSQQKKFDPKMEYIRKWVPEFDKSTYPKPMIDHSFARKRAIETYKSGKNNLP